MSAVLPCSNVNCKNNVYFRGFMGVDYWKQYPPEERLCRECFVRADKKDLKFKNDMGESNDERTKTGN